MSKALPPGTTPNPTPEQILAEMNLPGDTPYSKFRRATCDECGGKGRVFVKIAENRYRPGACPDCSGTGILPLNGLTP